MDILKFGEYEGTAEVDMEKGVCRGTILFINDLVTYESDTVKGLQAEFESAVTDYLETCKSLGRDPHKPCKGLFNVRISPDLHRAAVLLAKKTGGSLNDVVAQAIAAFVDPCVVKHKHKHEHEHSHTVKVELAMHDEVVTGSTPLTWHQDTKVALQNAH